MKFSQYNLVIEKEDKIILANTKNSNCVRITSTEDIKHIKELKQDKSKITPDDKMVEQLYQRGFIVSDDIDEYEEAKQDINKYLDAQSKLLNLTIYVTDNCNFRCIYCPEKHEPTRLSEENWENLYKYIENSIKDGIYTHISVSFGGGEPLLESRHILDFSNKILNFLKDYPDIKYQANIITNGYLLTPALYDKLSEAKIESYMISVDGFKETHEKMRPSANGKPTWDNIMNNLKYINSKDDNIKIELRANFNKINEETIPKYEKYLKETFTNPKFSFQFHPVVKFTDNVPDEYLAEPSGETWDKYFSVVGKHDDERSVEYKKNPFKKFNAICNAAHRGQIVVATDGRISKCHNIMSKEEAINSLIGKLQNDGTIKYDIDIEEWYKDPEREICKKCPVYPICCARKCPERAYVEQKKEDKDITYCNSGGILYVLEQYLIQNY